MDIQKIKELALANGFKLKEQADGSMDLNSYVYDFANAIEQAAKAHEAKKLEGCVVVPKDQTEDWYLDDNANMWITEPDEWLCDLYVGEVQSVEHKEYLITKSDTLYAVIVWDDENQDSGTWEFFKTEEEAEKAAAHCKAMLEAARGGNE